MAEVISYLAYALFVLTIVGTVLIVLTDDGESGKKIAWLLVIMFLPVVGLVLYLFFGFDIKRDRSFARKKEKFDRIFNECADDRTRQVLFGHSADRRIREEYRELSVLLSKSNGTTASDGNSVEIITSGKRKLEALIEDIKNARHHIHMEYFYFRKDDGSNRIKQLLMQKAREGVKVRFIHENIANIDIWPSYYNEMKEAGVEVVRFTNPIISILKFSMLLNHRDHRKIVVIDGRIGYTGGMNIGDDYFVRWRDTHLRLTGNAVYGLQYSFMYSFVGSGGSIDRDFGNYFPEPGPPSIPGAEHRIIQIVPDEPDDKWPILHMGAVWTALNAKSYLYIQTPYFVPPEPMLQALKSSALKGVDVRLMVPRKPDAFYMGPANRSYYSECLEAGIRIYEKTDRFTHSKTMVSDDYLSIIGSANMDYRSFGLNYEINTFIYDKGTAVVNRAIFLADMENCTEISPEAWENRPWYNRLLQSLVRLFAPIL